MLKRAITSLAMVATAAAVLGTAVPAFAADQPPNPVDKPGYTLDFQEEFNGTTLDRTKWIDYYLPHWAPNREDAKARYTIADGVLTERVDQNQVPWNPTYDSTVVTSALQTYNANWWHRFNGNMPNARTEPTFNGYSTMYGYFEIRAKFSTAGGGGHQAWWMVGTNDTTSASANPEIDIIESFFSKPSNWRIAAYGWGDPNFLGSWYLSDEAVPSGSPTAEWHVYAMDWTPTELRFYYDNVLYRTISDAPNMPMGMILNIYTGAGSGQPNGVWPKTWQVDYLRVWKSNTPPVTSAYVRIQNRNTAAFMNVENQTGNIQADTIQATAWSSQWLKESVGGYIRYKNRWTGKYIDTTGSSGVAVEAAVPSTYWTSQFTEEPVSGTSYVRLKAHQSGQYLNTENNTGSVQVGAVQPGWWSAQWQFVPGT